MELNSSLLRQTFEALEQNCLVLLWYFKVLLHYFEVLLHHCTVLL